EDGGDVVRDRIGEIEGVAGRNRQVLGKGARSVDSNPDRVTAQVPAAGAAVAAVAAGDVALAGDAIAALQAVHLRADLDDAPAVLVAHRHRHRDGLLRPGIPVVDVHVGAADRGLGDL